MSNTPCAVLHIEKGKGNDSGTSTHIERRKPSGEEYVPPNADKSRTSMNRELIRFHDSVQNRTQAIQYRINNAGLARKVGKNQVQCMRIVLSGSHEQMWKIVEEGKLDDWCKANLKWLRETYGEENVVSCVLHMDEKTPHLHATVVPITTAPRKRREREGGIKYAQKSGPRLSVTDFTSRAQLRKYQDTYAAEMKPFGLMRGVVCSTAKHISRQEYNKSLIRKQEQLIKNLEEQINNLSKDIETAEKTRKDLKESATARIYSWLGGGKLEQERESGRQKDQRIVQLEEQLQQEKDKLTEMKQNNQTEIKAMEGNYLDEIERAIDNADRFKKKNADLESTNRNMYRTGREMHKQLYPDRYKLSSGAEIADYEFKDDPELHNQTVFKIKTMVGNALNELWFKCKSEVVDRLNSYDMTLEELVNRVYQDPVRQLSMDQIDVLVEAGIILVDGMGGHYFSSGGGGSNSNLPWNDKDKRKGRRR